MNLWSARGALHGLVLVCVFESLHHDFDCLQKRDISTIAAHWMHLTECIWSFIDQQKWQCWGNLLLVTCLQQEPRTTFNSAVQLSLLFAGYTADCIDELFAHDIHRQYSGMHASVYLIYIYNIIYICSYAYVYVYVYMYMCMYTCICVCIHVYMMYTCICVCIYVYMYICMNVWMYICIYVYMYICVYVYMYICICTYINIFMRFYVILDEPIFSAVAIV